MTKAQFDLLSNAEKVGLIRITDEADCGNINAYGVFIDTDNIIQANTPFTTSATYTATEDCCVYILFCGNNTSSGFVKIDNKEVGKLSRNDSTGIFVGQYFYIKRGQTISVETPNVQGLSYTVYGIQSGSNVISKGGIDYSTNEQKTGQKWIDGSDIYQKTYVITSSDVTFSSYTTYNHGISNFGKVLNYNGYVTYPTDFRTFPSTTNDTRYNIGLSDYTSTQFGFSFGGSTISNIVNLTFTVQYTKTT